MIMKNLVMILLLIVTVGASGQVKFYKQGSGAAIGTAYVFCKNMTLVFNDDSTKLIVREGGKNVYSYDFKDISHYLKEDGTPYSSADEIITEFLEVDYGLKPYELLVSEGNINGVGSLFKFGAGSVTTDETVIWDGGDGYYGFLSAPTVLDIRSTSALDDDGSTGVWTMVVAGLGADSTEQSEILILNGTTTVTTTKQFIRVFRAFCLTGGSLASAPVSGANQGNINIFISGGTVVPDDLMARITTNKGQTLMSIYTVPKGKTLRVTGVGASVGAGKECTVSYKFRNIASGSGVFSTKYDLQLYQNVTFQELKIPLSVPEMTDIVVTGKAATGTVNVTASYGGYLEVNE
jgi:hypothetical protein